MESVSRVSSVVSEGVGPLHACQSHRPNAGTVVAVVGRNVHEQALRRPLDEPEHLEAMVKPRVTDGQGLALNRIG